MAIDLLVKQPSENVLYDMPFASIARAGTVITSILEVRIDNLGQVQGSAALTLVTQAFSGLRTAEQ